MGQTVQNAQVERLVFVQNGETQKKYRNYIAFPQKSGILTVGPERGQQKYSKLTGGEINETKGFESKHLRG